MVKAHLRAPILLSIAAALATLALKTLAYLLTNSVGMLSDAAESLVNLMASLAAYLALGYAARPVDRDHHYGHEKIEYFASGFEGALILVAAGTIGWCAISRLYWHQPLELHGDGLLVSLLATTINGIVALVLFRVARRHESIVLEAEGWHLLTDVWTGLAVLFGLGLALLTGHTWLDGALALIVAANILRTAWKLMWRSFQGLMDQALPESELNVVRAAVQATLGPNTAFHALRTRRAGASRFIEFHLLVPGQTPVHEAHALADCLEDAIKSALAGAEVTIHIEPIEERASWEDSALVQLERRAEERGR